MTRLWADAAGVGPEYLNLLHFLVFAPTDFPQSMRSTLVLAVVIPERNR